jgi:hypothetical protein
MIHQRAGKFARMEMSNYNRTISWLFFVLFSLGGVKLMGIETHLDESQNGGDTSRNQFGVRKQKERKKFKFPFKYGV